MNDYRNSLRTVGMVLIILGVFDFAWDVYRMAGRGWALSSGTFAVIPGIILCKGSLKAARVVAFFAAFLLVWYVAFALATPFTLRIPLDLGLTYLRLRPFSVAQGAFWLIGPVILSAWVYRRLTAPVILAAMDEEHIGYRRPWQKPAAGFVVGAVILIVIAAVTNPLMRELGAEQGKVAERAKVEAKKKVGSGHKFFVSSWTRRYEAGGKTSVRATVTAYNRREIRDVKVTWEQ